VGEPPRYVVGRSPVALPALLAADEGAWAAAQRISWGPEAIATSFRALWTDAGLAVRFDVTDPSPWHTLTQRDDRLWNEEVVELFLDVGATGRSYAELEWNPANTVVDLWVDRAENRFDKDWNAMGHESRVHARKDAAGRPVGWTVVAQLPWSALGPKAPVGTAVPPLAGDVWRFNVFRIERPGGPAESEKDAQYLAFSPTGQTSFHVPAAFREIVFAGPAGSSLATPGQRLPASCVEESRVAMGCTCTVRACGGETAALRAAAAAALDEVDRLDWLLSHYRRDSPLSRVNRDAASGPVAVEPELLDLLAECLRWSRESDGAFDVTVGPLMKAWGFFQDEMRVPSKDDLARALEVVGYRRVVLDREAGTVRFERPGVELDLGGIGKGYALDRAVAVLRGRGVSSALVNLGGSSVYGLGAPPGSAAWEVGIQDPTHPSRTARTVALRDRALSVSGGYGRSFVKDGVTYGHILDPRSGEPVRGVLGVAVLSDSGTAGDALDNVLFVLGPEAGRDTLGRVPCAEAFLYQPQGERGFREVRLSSPPGGR
jgi:thiamine biosynthesis lipoprotein